MVENYIESKKWKFLNFLVGGKKGKKKNQIFDEKTEK